MEYPTSSYSTLRPSLVEVLCLIEVPFEYIKDETILILCKVSVQPLKELPELRKELATYHSSKTRSMADRRNRDDSAEEGK